MRLMIPLGVVLIVVYAALSLYSRSVRKAKLEQEWDEAPGTGDRDAFIDAGLRAYQKSFRRKLLLLVFVAPLVLIAFMVYLTNYR